MKNYQLALALLVSLPALAWLSSSASPAAPTTSTRDPLVRPLPPEAFGQIDAWTDLDEDGTISCTFYNGSEYVVESLDFEVTISDFKWAGEEHNSRTWIFRWAVASWWGEGAPLDMSFLSHDLDVEVKAATVKLIGANGTLP